MARLAGWLALALVLCGLAFIVELAAFVAAIIGGVIAMHVRFRNRPAAR